MKKRDDNWIRIEGEGEMIPSSSFGYVGIEDNGVHVSLFPPFLADCYFVYVDSTIYTIYIYIYITISLFIHQKRKKRNLCASPHIRPTLLSRRPYRHHSLLFHFSSAPLAETEGSFDLLYLLLLLFALSLSLLDSIRIVVVVSVDSLSYRPSLFLFVCLIVCFPAAVLCSGTCYHIGERSGQDTISSDCCVYSIKDKKELKKRRKKNIPTQVVVVVVAVSVLVLISSSFPPSGGTKKTVTASPRSPATATSFTRGGMSMFHFNKPPGPMHEDIKRAVEELYDRHNPHLALTILNAALANTEFSAVVDFTHPSATPQPAAPSLGSPCPRPLQQPGCYQQQRHHKAGRAARQPTAGRLWSPSRRGDRRVTGVVHGAVVSSAATSTTDIPAVSVSRQAPQKGWDGYNAIQMERLLLLRSDAYAMTSAHEKSLKDAQAAVGVSGGQSPFAYYAVGRQHRYMWAIEEAIVAFDTAEGLVASVTQAYLKVRGASEHYNWSSSHCMDLAVWNRKNAVMSDEDFWAAHGFSPQEVEELGLSRAEFELQQTELLRSREEHRWRQGVGASAAAATPLASGNPQPNTSSRTSSPHSPDGGTAAASSSGAVTSPAPDEALSDLELMALFGMDSNELMVWRKLATECKALMAVNVSQTIPSSSYDAALTTLNPKVTAVRTGTIIAIENSCASQPLRFVGAVLNGAGHLAGYTFPQQVDKGHVGLVLLQSTSWSGFHGSLCFEMDHQLCCFLYFDVPVLASKKVGVRLLEHSSADLKLGFDELNGEATTTTTTPVARPAPRIAATTAAVRAVKIPPSSVWLPSTTANSARRRVKVLGTVADSRVVHFVVAEIPAVPLTPVDLLPALEYAGPAALKKLSAVSRSYREVVNHLPPHMFGSAQRQTAYPDYLLCMDRYSSPWVVRDRSAVNFKITTETRSVERVEYSLIDVANPTQTVMWISSETQSRDGTVMFGDPQHRKILTHVRDHWGLFVNSVFYCESPLGNHFASIACNPQGHFTFTFNGYGAKPEQIMYTARKHRTSQVHAGRVAGQGVHVDPNSNATGAVRGIVSGTVTNNSGGGGGGGASAYAPNPTPSRVVNASPGASATGGGTGSANATGATSGVTHQEVYSVWRPKQQCGAALINCPPQNTNSGEEFIAELVVLPSTLGRRSPVAELKLYPGADALLVTMLAYVMLRW
eukprot:gene3839-2719_t